MKAFARLALLLLGSMRALFVCIAICAAALLLSACGPTDTEALQDVALDLSDIRVTFARAREAMEARRA